MPTRALYAAPNRRTTHRLVRLDTNRGEWMRAPGEASGLLALECAMDELAEQLGLDPIELRIRNEPERDPERNVPFSSRNLIACMREGAARFGWQRSPGEARQPARRPPADRLRHGGGDPPNYLRAGLGPRRHRCARAGRRCRPT